MDNGLRIEYETLPRATQIIVGSHRPYPFHTDHFDYFLQPDLTIIRVGYKDYIDPDHKTYPDAIPLIWYGWLRSHINTGDTRALSVGNAIVIASTGLKGSGKSLTVALLSCKALVKGMPIWSNMGIKFFLVRPDGSLQYCESKTLDWNAVLSLSGELKGGALVIDELSYFASSRQSSSVRNRIINAAINQVRKRTLDFYTSVKFLRQIDVNIREELDAQIACEDFSLIGRNQENGLGKGCHSKWKVRDISGWSGHPTPEYQDRLGAPVYGSQGYIRRFDGRPLWPVYNSYEVVEMADAFRKVRLDLRETVISDKDSGEVPNLLREVAMALRDAGQDSPSTDEFREFAAQQGVVLSDKTMGKALKGIGIERKRTNAGNIYPLGGMK